MSFNSYRKKWSILLTIALLINCLNFPIVATTYSDLEAKEEVEITEIDNGYRMSNEYFEIRTGEYGQITHLYIQDDMFPTNYVMNIENSPEQDTAGHQWFGELMFQTKVGEEEEWTESLTNSSDDGRTIEVVDDKIVVTYENATGERAINDFKVVETYSLVEDQFRWEIEVVNTNEDILTIGDLGIPLAFNQRFPHGNIYEERVIAHTFIGNDSSYVYATRPSGLGQFLLMTPDQSTGAGFEYQDHWRVQERRDFERAWCQDQSGWENGLNVYYVHSEVIKSTNRGYLENTSLQLQPGESKMYAFNFTAVDDEADMKSRMYDEGIMDAVAVPSMTFAKNMPAKMYLHTSIDVEDIEIEIQCPHETGLHQDNANTTSNLLPHTKNDENTYAKYVETKVIDGENYHIYDLKFEELGHHNVIVNYLYNEELKQTTLQFYIMDEVAEALDTHSTFMIEKTQWDAPGEIYDKVFDDWMMDTKSKRGAFDGYWGWGDDWGLTHGQFLAEKNVYQPVAEEIEALDEYLDVAIWNGLMQEHQEDYMIRDFLMPEPNTTPTYRGYAYPHIYNTYFSMYKIATKYPDMIEYKEDANTYLLRAYNILNRLYGPGVAYNWGTGLMGELTTPDIIDALEREGFYEEAENIRDIMDEKYDSFKAQKYPYGSEYSYDNTGEEAVYTLAKMQLEEGKDVSNAWTMMDRINSKTRASRSLKPVWYHYGSPMTICGEAWWQFQYTASLAGYTMDDWLRLQDNGMTEEERALASRINYAGKLANLTCINSGQINADPDTIGTVSWTYQSEMGNLGGQGTGGGNLHNGWRQMSGEADLGLFGALSILSADIVTDPVFGLFGYGAEVTLDNGYYHVTPLDGLFTRLNFINEELYIELLRDQYTEATVKQDKSEIILEMKNLEQTAHDVEVEIIGLKPGSYQVAVNGTVTGSFQAISGETAYVTYPLPAASAATVRIYEGPALDNTAPIVNAGEDTEVHISDAFRLEGKATDDGYPKMTLESEWSVVSTPEGGEAILANPDKLITGVTFTEVGTYEFKLTVSDTQLQSSDTVIVNVLEDIPVPENLGIYTFDNLDNEKHLVIDESGEGYPAKMVGYPDFTEGKNFTENEDDQGVLMDGSFTGYIKLSPDHTNRVEEVTIATDVKLNGIQGNGTRLFEFSDMNDQYEAENYFYVSFVNGNELALTVTDLTTGQNRTVNSGVVLSPDYWKNVGVTVKDNTVILYVDGIERARIEDVAFSFAELGEVQRNFIGRSHASSIPFLDGVVDNFHMKSIALSEEEMAEAYGFDGEREIVSTIVGTIVTQVGVEPVLPDTVNALYSDGLIEPVPVVWEPVNEEDYAEAGVFTVNGVVEETDINVEVSIMVVEGELKNLAYGATPSAIVDTPQDLGGVTMLNNGHEPSSSSDTSGGVWHNWLGGDQGGTAWVQYDWDEPVILTGSDVYYFRDGSGNFQPATVELQYRDEETGAWVAVSNAIGLGVELNEFNYTSFDAIVTTGLRMVMNPKELGVGVIEWKVYGYSDGVEIPVNKKELNTAIEFAKGLNLDLFEEGMEVLELMIKEAEVIQADGEATQEAVDEATHNLLEAISKLVPVDENVAFNAMVSTSYVSPWENLSAVNDGMVSEDSSGSGITKYGTWGNESAEESITYTWSIPIEISDSKIYFWNDGGGIRTPKGYRYEYMDEDGNWIEVFAGGEEAVELDQFNVVTFDEEIVTTSFRITIEKPELSGEGIGVIEWQVSGRVFEEVEEQYVTVRFDSMGGSYVEDIVTTTGSAIQAPGDPIRSGYEFEGWYKEDMITLWNFRNDHVYQDMTLYAKWSKVIDQPDELVTVRFNSMGGSYVEDVVTTTGSAIQAPGDPIRSGYEFEGWYKEDRVTLWNFRNDRVYEDMTLYAKWSKVTDQPDELVTVRFNSMGGSYVEDIVTTTGSAIQAPGDPIRSGYEFEGWYKEDMITLWNFRNDRVYENMTLYAKWKRRSSSSSSTPSNDKVQSPKETKELENLIKDSSSNIDEVKQVSISLEPNSAGGYNLLLPDNFISEEHIQVELIADEMSLVIDNTLFKEDASDIEISINVIEINELEVEEMETKQFISPKVYDISISVNGENVEVFDENYISVSINLEDISEEYKAHQVVAVYINEQGEIEIQKLSYFKEGVLKFNTNHLSQFGVIYNPITFIDIEELAWAKESIEALAAKGIINGTSEITYSPKDNISRADFITLLVRLFDLQGINTEEFNDVVEGEYYYDSVQIAKANGIISADENNNFRPMEKITRQDMMVYLEQALSVTGNKDRLDLSDKTITSFDDYLEVDEYAVESVDYLISTGLIEGSDNKILPEEETTRAEVAVMLNRLLNELLK